MSKVRERERERESRGGRKKVSMPRRRKDDYVIDRFDHSLVESFLRNRGNFFFFFHTTRYLVPYICYCTIFNIDDYF